MVRRADVDNNGLPGVDVVAAQLVILGGGAASAV
jgi:hypothetical protein